MKRLVVLFDGTWNDLNSNTNVYKIRQLLSCKDPEGIEQIPEYMEGVGTKWWNTRRGGAFGYGISDKIIGAYEWLKDNYQEDESEKDEIYLFGFSRGAFAAIGLAGFIHWSGLLRCKAIMNGRECYERYQKAAQLDRESHKEEAQPFKELANRQKEELSATSKALLRQSRDVSIKFLGLWDTVRAAGREPLVPRGIGRRLSGTGTLCLRYTRHVAPNVENAFHALAVDEHRAQFEPRIWIIPQSNLMKKRWRVIEQRWFVGAHSNVGGGYKDDRLSNIPLRWMQEKAHDCGLRFERFVEVGPDDHLVKPADSFANMYENRWWKRWFRTPLSKATSYYERYFRPLQQSPGPWNDYALTEAEVLDKTVLRRLEEDPTYRPKNLKRFWPVREE